jgi:UDP-glucose:(heptosyl)LPS alpha-1,3-glucosyltransferase
VRLALLLFKYFPFGGLQRDFARFAAELQQRGHECRVYCGDWQGDVLPGVQLRHVPVMGTTNVRRDQRYHRWVMADLATDPVDGVIGFNRMPGLDVYYAADPCFLDKALQGRGPWYRLGSRFRHFSRWERAVFDPAAATEILLISASERDKFVRHYHTPPARLHLLPPGVSPDRRAPANATQRRAITRAALGLRDDTHVLLLVGSGFVTKGLDRAIRALASLRVQHPGKRFHLLVAGQDRPGRFGILARRAGVQQQVEFLGGRHDIAELMLAADVLVHPARSEAAGIVLLEALVAGLPVVVTAVCGYAGHIAAADAGIVLPAPFSQAALEAALARCLDPDFRALCRQHGLAYAAREDLYSMHATGARLIERLVERKCESKLEQQEGLPGA